MSNHFRLYRHVGVFSLGHSTSSLNSGKGSDIFSHFIISLIDNNMIYGLSLHKSSLLVNSTFYRLCKDRLNITLTLLIAGNDNDMVLSQTENKTGTSRQNWHKSKPPSYLVPVIQHCRLINSNIHQKIYFLYSSHQKYRKIAVDIRIKNYMLPRKMLENQY